MVFMGYLLHFSKYVCFFQAGLHKLELNPYWKDGGSGLPPEETAQTAVKKGKNLPS